VFGDEVGKRVKSVKKAWRTAVLRAHGVKAVWTPSNQLDAVSTESTQRSTCTSTTFATKLEADG